MTEVKLNAFLNEDHNNYDEIARTGFTRNQVLIDLINIPTDIKESIIHTYDNTKPAPRSKLIPYFMDKKLKNLMDVIGEF